MGRRSLPLAPCEGVTKRAKMMAIDAYPTCRLQCRIPSHPLLSGSQQRPWLVFRPFFAFLGMAMGGWLLVSLLASDPIPGALCASRRERVNLNDDGGPANPEMIAGFLQRALTDESFRAELAGCLTSNVTGLELEPFRHEVITVGDAEVYYPTCLHDGKMVTGADAIKAAVKRLKPTCSRSAFAAALYMKAQGELERQRRQILSFISSEDRAQTYVKHMASAMLYAASAAIADRPMMAGFLHGISKMRFFENRIVKWLVSFKSDAYNMSGYAEAWKEQVKLMTSYGDFLSLELSGNAPRVARSFLKLLTKELIAKLQEPLSHRSASSRREDPSRVQRQRDREKRQEEMRKKYNLPERGARQNQVVPFPHQHSEPVKKGGFMGWVRKTFLGKSGSSEDAESPKNEESYSRWDEPQMDDVNPDEFVAAQHGRPTQSPVAAAQERQKLLSNTLAASERLNAGASSYYQSARALANRRGGKKT